MRTGRYTGRSWHPRGPRPQFIPTHRCWAQGDGKGQSVARMVYPGRSTAPPGITNPGYCITGPLPVLPPLAHLHEHRACQHHCSCIDREPETVVLPELDNR